MIEAGVEAIGSSLTRVSKQIRVFVCALCILFGGYEMAANSVERKQIPPEKHERMVEAHRQKVASAIAALSDPSPAKREQAASDLFQGIYNVSDTARAFSETEWNIVENALKKENEVSSKVRLLAQMESIHHYLDSDASRAKLLALLRQESKGNVFETAQEAAYQRFYIEDFSVEPKRFSLFGKIQAPPGEYFNRGGIEGHTVVDFWEIHPGNVQKQKAFFLPKLKELFEKEKDDRTLIEALAVLGAMGYEASPIAPSVLELASRATPLVAALAVRIWAAVSSGSEPYPLSQLTALTRHPFWRVRHEAWMTFVRSGRIHELPANVRAALAKDPIAEVRKLTAHIK